MNLIELLNGLPHVDVFMALAEKEKGPALKCSPEVKSNIL